jgi:hypothetical protein
MPFITIAEPESAWIAPNCGDGPDESWKSLIVKVNAMNEELFARVEALEASEPKGTTNV